MKKLFFASLLFISIVVLILGGCKPSNTSITEPTETDTPTTVTTPNKVLKIGSVQALNNPAGVEQKKWLDLFAKLLNEQGGWKIGADTYNVAMIVYDSEGDAGKAKNYLEKLVLQDGVKFVLGSPTSSPATDSEVTEPEKVICLGIDVIGNSADPKIHYYWTPMGMFFSRGYMYYMYNDVAARGMKSYVSLKPDNQIGQVTDMWCNATWAVAAPSVKYIDTVFYDPTTTDFGPVATKIKSLNPDVLDCSFNDTGVAPYNALYDVGFKGTIFPALNHDQYAAVISHCGEAFVEGWECGLQDPRLYPNQDPEILTLIDAYTKEYGTFSTDGCSWICYWFVLKDAIENTQSINVETIKAYLDNNPHPVRTMTGYCQLFARPDAGNLRTVSGEPAEFVGIIKDGEITPLNPVAIKDHYLASILSYGLVDVYKEYWEQYGYPIFPAGQTSVIKFSDLGITGKD